MGSRTDGADRFSYGSAEQQGGRKGRKGRATGNARDTAVETRALLVPAIRRWPSRATMAPWCDGQAAPFHWLTEVARLPLAGRRSTEQSRNHGQRSAPGHLQQVAAAGPLGALLGMAPQRPAVQGQQHPGSHLRLRRGSACSCPCCRLMPRPRFPVWPAAARPTEHVPWPGHCAGALHRHELWRPDPDNSAAP